MRKFGVPVAPCILALVLGDLAELSLRRSLLLSGGKPPRPGQQSDQRRSARGCALGIPCPEIQEPDAYRIDESMFIFPDEQAKDTPVFRGPNIGEPPRSEKMTRDLAGRVMIKLGNNITTDHITPAGARLKYRSNVLRTQSSSSKRSIPRFQSAARKTNRSGFTKADRRGPGGRAFEPHHVRVTQPV
jgi:hypothetical protein